MKVGKINEFLGSALIFVGVTRVVIIFGALLSSISVLSGGKYNIDNDFYLTISEIIAMIEIIVIITCLIMFFINKKKQTGVTKGYLYALFAFLIEIFLVFPLINFFVVIYACMQYIKAGNRVKEDNFNYLPQNKKIGGAKADWFYSESNIKNTEKELLKLQKNKEKIDEEIKEWKELVNMGEITEEVFLQETKKLTEKSKNLEEQISKYNLLNKNN